MSFKKAVLKFSYGTLLMSTAMLIPIGMAADNPHTPAKHKTATTAVATLKTPTTKKAVKPAKPKIKAHIWNLQNADIRSVINEISRETGKNFVISPQVNGKVDLIATKPLKPKELYQVFLSVLQVYGFAAIKEGDIVKIVPNNNASQLVTKVTSKKNPASGDEIVSSVVHIRFVSATQLVPILRPMLPQWANIAAYAPTNSLVITGHASNVKQISNIVKQVDTQSDGGTDIVHLKNANAKEVVTIIKSLESTEQSYGGTTEQVSAIADTRTNSIVLSGSEEQRLRMRVVISQLDSPSDNGAGGNTQVIFLHYLSAKKLAPILDKVAKGESQIKAAAKSGKTEKTAPKSGGDSSSSDNLNSLSAVLPEIDNNALIITAPSAMMKNLKNIIQELDTRPAEVFVQAIIVELDASNMEKLGIQWGTFETDSSSNPADTGGDSTSPNSSFQGGAGVAIIKNGRFRELVAAIKGMSGANILSQPTIMVLDNKKASFDVGKQISYQTQALTSGSATTSSGEPVITSNFQQENVGLKLNVTPQVDEDNTVQLAIDQENGTLQNPDNPGTTPIINQSKIKTTVMVNSGDILVLGGLMSNSMTTATYGTPILSDIPIIGQLFTYKQHELEKKDLMVFLRPIIVDSPLVGTRISNAKYKYIRQLQASWNTHDIEEDNPDQRILPPNGQNLNLPLPFSD